MAALEPGQRWRLGVLLAEAPANLRSRTGRSAALALVVALVVAALMWAETATARMIIQAKHDLVAAGGLVAVVAREDGATLPAPRCSLLGQLPHVAASGGLRKGSIIHFGQAPATPFQSVEVTDSLLAIVSPGSAAAGAGVVLSRAASDELGVTGGAWVSLLGSPVAVAGIVDTEERAESLSRTVFLPAPPTGGVHQCWVEFHDGAFEQGVQALPAWFAGEGTLTIHPLVDRNAGTRDLAGDWWQRPTRDGWIMGAILIGAFLVMLLWRRRAEFALYLLLGSSRSGVAVLLTAEMYTVVLAGGLLGVAWGAWIVALTGGVAQPALVLGMRAAGLCLLLTLAMLAASLARLIPADTAAILKERPG